VTAHPYRTAPVATEPQRPWWRRALCAIGRHSLYLQLDLRSHQRHVVCEHCGRSWEGQRVSVIQYLKAYIRTAKRDAALVERTESTR
jgi:hypothetical protein